MSKKNVKEEPAADQMSAEEAEALYKRVEPMVTELSAYCGELNLRKRLTTEKFQELVDKYQLSDLNVTPETVVSLLGALMTPLAKEHNQTSMWAEGNKGNDLALRSMFFAQHHLLSLMGHAPSDPFAKLYGQPLPSSRPAVS